MDYDILEEDPEFVTTDEVVALYRSSSNIFGGLLKEVRELSRKKASATMSAPQVKIINRVLDDLLSFLKDEPEGKYLERLDDASLPQLGDAVLVMVQFETALKSFPPRYRRCLVRYGNAYWVTEGFLQRLKDGEQGEGDEDGGE